MERSYRSSCDSFAGGLRPVVRPIDFARASQLTRRGVGYSAFDDRTDREWAMTGENVDVDWRLSGVRVVRADEVDVNTPQTPGMNRAAAIEAARAGAEKLWAGTVTIHPDAKTGAHHHGPVESVIYVVSGRARMRWGERLEYMAEAGPGDFIYVPPFVPHQEINARQDAPLSCVVVRRTSRCCSNSSMAEPNPESVHWVDDIHGER